MNKKLLLGTVAAVLAATAARAQTKIGDNPATINPNAILELESTNKGLLLPRVSLTGGTTSPAPLAAHVAGMAVYNTTTIGDTQPGYYYNDGARWVRLSDNLAIRATNGLTRNADSIQLGGALTGNTVVAGNAFTSTFSSTQSADEVAALNAVANPGNAIPAGNNVYASKNIITGNSVPGATTTLRAQYNSATTTSNNTRVFGSLNEASASGQGLGADNTPQATGTTGLADYNGTGAAAADDYLVGVRGATYTSAPAGNVINALNVVGATFDGSFQKSVGGYFFPGNGSSNLGTVSQINGTENAGWRDTTFAGKNVAVVAMDAAGGAPKAITATNLAIYSNGNVQLSNLPATGSTALVGIDAAGNLSTTAIPAATTANNGLTQNGNTVQLGGTLNQATNVALNGNTFSISNATNPTALFRNDGSIALGNSAPVYSDNKLEINLQNVGGTQINGEQNQGVNILGSALNGSALSVGLRSRMDVPAGSAVGGARGVQSNVNINGNLNGGAGAMFFNSNLGAAGTLSANASLTGISGDAGSSAGAPAGAATNRFVGARFGANATNTSKATALGMGASAIGSATSNTGITATAAIVDTSTNNAGIVTAVGPFATVAGAAATARAGRNAALVAVNPNAASTGTGNTERAIYSSGGVQLANLGTTAATSLVGIDAAGNLSTTAIPAATTAGNGLTQNGNAVQLGGVLTQDVLLDGATNQKGLTLTGNANTELGLFKVQNNITIPNPAGTSNNTQVVTASLDGVAGTGNQAGDVVAHLADAYSSSDDYVVIGSENFGTTPLSNNVQGDFTHAIGTNGVAFANGNLAASAPNAMVIGASGGVSFNDVASNWNAIGTEGYLNFNQSTSGKAAAGHFDGNGTTSSGTGFGVIGSMGDDNLYQTMFDPALAGYKVGVAAVNHNPNPTATDLALYTEGNVMMANLTAGAGTDVLTRDAATGNVGFVKAYAASAPLIFNAPANDFSDQTVNISGVADGDAIYLGVPSIAVVAMGSYSAFVSAPGVVTVRFTNNTTSAQTPSGTFKIKVMQ